MSLEHVLLGFIAQKSRTGYELKTRCFDREATWFWPADQAQIYRTLARLEADGMVTSRRQRQTSRPDRKVYSLTALGGRALREWLGGDTYLPSPRDPFLARLRFSSALGDEELSALVLSSRELHQSRLDALRERAMTHPLPGTSQRSLALQAATLQGAIVQERAWIDWLDDLAATVDQGEIPAPDPVSAEVG